MSELLKNLSGKSFYRFKVLFGGDDSCYLDVKFTDVSIYFDESELQEPSQEIDIKCVSKDGHVIGKVHLELANNDGVTYLGEIAVSSRYHNQGYGSQLLRFVEFISQEFNNDKIEGHFGPDNDRKKTRSFYEHNGYNIDKYGRITKELFLEQNYNDIVLKFPKEKNEQPMENNIEQTNI